MKEYKLIPAQIASVDGSPFDNPPTIINDDERYYYDHLFVIGNEYGALCAVWADNEQDALDIAADANDGTAMNGLRLDAETAHERETEHEGEGIMYLGNAGEAFDSIYAWISEVQIEGV